VESSWSGIYIRSYRGAICRQNDAPRASAAQTRRSRARYIDPAKRGAMLNKHSARRRRQNNKRELLQRNLASPASVWIQYMIDSRAVLSQNIFFGGGAWPLPFPPFPSPPSTPPVRFPFPHLPLPLSPLRSRPLGKGTGPLIPPLITVSVKSQTDQ